MKIPDTIRPGDLYKDIILVKHQNAVEIPEARGFSSKLFSRGGRRFSLVSGGALMHYFDGTLLRDIDLSFVDTARGFYCQTAPYKVLVYKDKVGYEYESRVSGKVTVELISIAGEKVKKATGIATGNKVTYTDVAPGLDFLFALKETEVEFFKILNNAGAPRTWTWRITEEQNGKAKFNAKTFGVDADQWAVRCLGAISNEKNIGKDRVFEYTETWTGEVSRVADKALARRQRDWFLDPAYPVTIDVSTSDDITATADDGREIAAYSAWHSAPYSSYNANIWGYPVPPSGNWHGGVRFQTVNIPQGATINSATITFQVIAIYGTAPTLKIYGDKVSSAAAWSNTSRPSQVTKTTATVSYTETTTGARAVNVASIVQEIVNQAGWAANNNMRFALLNSVTGSNKRLLVNDLKAGATQDAVLACDYTAAAADSYSGRGVGRGIGRGIMR